MLNFNEFIEKMQNELLQNMSDVFRTSNYGIEVNDQGALYVIDSENPLHIPPRLELDGLYKYYMKVDDIGLIISSAAKTYEERYRNKPIDNLAEKSVTVDLLDYRLMCKKDIVPTIQYQNFDIVIFFKEDNKPVSEDLLIKTFGSLDAAMEQLIAKDCGKIYIDRVLDPDFDMEIYTAIEDYGSGNISRYLVNPENDFVKMSDAKKMNVLIVSSGDSLHGIFDPTKEDLKYAEESIAAMVDVFGDKEVVNTLSLYSYESKQIVTQMEDIKFFLKKDTIVPAINEDKKVETNFFSRFKR